MAPNRYLFRYLAADSLTAWLAWLLFWYVRKTEFEIAGGPLEFNLTVAGTSGVFLAFWLVLFWAVGLYRAVYRHSRLTELGRLAQISSLGVLFISFETFLDDPLVDFTLLRSMVLRYYILHLVLVGTGRLLLTTFLKNRIGRGRLGFRTVLIGCGPTAEALWQHLHRRRPSAGFQIIGYVNPTDCPPHSENNRLTGRLKRLGNLAELPQILTRRKAEEVLVALEKTDNETFGRIVALCAAANVHINAVPELYSWMVGRVKMQPLLDLPLVEIYPRLMAPWEQAVKRAMDVVFSSLALLMLSPVFTAVALLIRWDSRGPVFYRQERIGRHFKPFQIIKFRSMFVDAEKHGPSLSSDFDPRITKVGRFLRKTRLDEIPQFYNVLLGDMSLVGPRPERRFFIDQIVAKAPEYLHLLKVKPGITSLGQVRYGYAENVDQMVERLRYDLLYIENISLAFDLKILLYTVRTVIEGRGK